MASQLGLITLLSHLLGAVALIAMCFGFIRRLDLSAHFNNTLLGLLFGLATIAATLSPIEISPGVTIDGRTMLLAFAAGFGGPLSFLIAAPISIAAKIVVSGSFVPVSMAGTMCVGVTGLLWHFLILPRWQFHTRSLVSLGIMNSAVMLLFFLMPSGLELFIKSYPVTLATFIIGSVLVGKFIERELRHIEREKTFKREAITDPLTGLSNRRSFAQKLEAMDAAQSEASVLILDVDHFKRVNDTYGHGAGDVVLRDLAVVINMAIGRMGHAYRIGGEEFSAVLHAAPMVALPIAETIRVAVERHAFMIENVRVPVTISIGLSARRNGMTARRAAEEADKALYLAKAGGRNRSIVYDVKAASETRPAAVPGQNSGVLERLVG